MSTTPINPAHIAGIVPWFPWPLSAWPWWTTPVGAERLAAWRIGIALTLLLDILLQYAPDTLAYFARGSLGEPGLFDWQFRGPRMTWSLLRGFGDAAAQSVSLVLWMATTAWIFGNSLARLLLATNNPPKEDRTGMAWCIWLAAFGWYVASLWAQMIADSQTSRLAWLVPLLGCSLVCLFFSLDLATRLRDPVNAVAWLPISLLLVGSVILLGLGFALTRVDLTEIDKTTWWLKPFRSWQGDDVLLLVAMYTWIGSAALLMIGLCTRYMALLAWIMSMSFANANPNLDNAGDTIRLILLFYLMFCPCGAVWSMDALFRRSKGPIVVSPWPIRLIFVQMIFIYWMNGIYKLLGADWLAGSSLYYVLGDIALVRFTRSALPVPPELARIMTWSVLVWETTFPLFVFWTWPRRIALFFGVMFHLGIFATMELGCFVPYALCMYLPFAPWERLRRSPAADMNAGKGNGE